MFGKVRKKVRWKTSAAYTNVQNWKQLISRHSQRSKEPLKKLEILTSDSSLTNQKIQDPASSDGQTIWMMAARFIQLEELPNDILNLNWLCLTKVNMSQACLKCFPKSKDAFTSSWHFRTISNIVDFILSRAPCFQSSLWALIW